MESARPTVRDLVRWATELQEAATRIGPRFSQSEPKGRVLAYVRGRLSAVERKNRWQLAE